MLLRRYLFAIFWIGILHFNAAQDSSGFFKNSFLKLEYQHGFILPTDDYLKGENELEEPIDQIRGFSMEVGKQTTGISHYDVIMGYPTYGVGFAKIHFS